MLHQAALPSVPRSVQDPLTSHEVNATGTLNVLLAARDAGVERVVFASSSSVYGADPEVPTRETWRRRRSRPTPSPSRRRRATAAPSPASTASPTLSLRYFNVFGPRQDPVSQYAAVIPNFVTALLAGRPPTVYGDGGQTP